MDKKTRIEQLADSEEEKFLLARVYDKLSNGVRRNIPVATCFLSPREQLLVKEILAELPLCFFGGIKEAERKICCWLPEYLEESWLWSGDSPIAAVHGTFYEKDQLTHRDLLGSLMGSGIKRETVGDIYVEKGSCTVLLLKEMQRYVLDNVLNAGRTRLHMEPVSLDQITAPNQVRLVRKDTVSSLRLDSIISSGFGMSRGRSAALIQSGKVFLNDFPCIKPDRSVAEGDKVSARGFGKIVLRTIGTRTKKDRISIVLEKYQ